MEPGKSSKVKTDGPESRRWLSAPASLTSDSAKEMKGSPSVLENRAHCFICVAVTYNHESQRQVYFRNGKFVFTTASSKCLSTFSKHVFSKFHF